MNLKSIFTTHALRASALVNTAEVYLLTALLAHGSEGPLPELSLSWI